MAIARACAAPMLAAAGLAAMLAIPATALAETKFPPHGAQGDVETPLRCPPEMYVIGFAGNTGAWIDSIKILCGRMTSEGMVGSDWSSPVVGGSGGGYNNARCENGMAVNKIMIVLTEDNRQVWAISPTCYGAFNGTIGGAHADNGNGSFAGTIPTHSGGGIGISDEPAQMPIWQECRGGDLATGLTVRYGKHVNAVGLICNTIVKAAPPAPPEAPRPPPLKSTGKMPGPSGPVSTLGFAGDWQTVTGSNGHFAMTFQFVGTPTPGQPLQFTGTFVNTDGAHEYDGTLQGSAVFPSGVLNFTYSQPGIQAAGTGTFYLSSDGKSFTGDGVSMGKDKFTWNGTR